MSRVDPERAFAAAAALIVRDMQEARAFGRRRVPPPPASGTRLVERTTGRYSVKRRFYRHRVRGFVRVYESGVVVKGKPRAKGKRIWIEEHWRGSADLDPSQSTLYRHMRLGIERGMRAA